MCERVILQFYIFHCQNLFAPTSRGSPYCSFYCQCHIQVWVDPLSYLILIQTSGFSFKSLTSKKRKLHHRNSIILSRAHPRPRRSLSLCECLIWNIIWYLHIVLTNCVYIAAIPFTWMNMCIIMSVIYYAWTAIFLHSTGWMVSVYHFPLVMHILQSLSDSRERSEEDDWKVGGNFTCISIKSWFKILSHEKLLHNGNQCNEIVIDIDW